MLLKKPAGARTFSYSYCAAMAAAFLRTISRTSGGEVTCTSAPNCMIQLTSPSDTAASKCVSKWLMSSAVSGTDEPKRSYTLTPLQAGARSRKAAGAF